MFQIKVAEKIRIYILRSIPFLPKIVPFMRCQNMWSSQGGSRWQFGSWINKATHAQAHASARAPTPTYACTHPCTTRTHAQKYVICTPSLLLNQCNAGLRMHFTFPSNVWLSPTTVVEKPHVFNCLFSICVQVYWPLPPGGNPIAINKFRYHIITVNTAFSRVCISTDTTCLPV
jgi:hypothetical protein